MPAPRLDQTCRLKIQVTGTVQSVGFRPFVFNLACELGLFGFVKNQGGQVEIELEGQRHFLDQFLKRLNDEAPPLAVIDKVEVSEIPPCPRGEEGFRIEISESNKVTLPIVPGDTATCRDCLDELFDPNDRRFRYPFINCTNCGPRFTIIKAFPYDRQKTTMAQFAMCMPCRAEYENPSDRRFHAQPIACPACGPHIWFCSKEAGEVEVQGESALAQAIAYLRSGKILAVKGLGGFHLVCDAENNQAVASLRARKRRAAKPLALMFPSLEMLRDYCLVSQAEADILAGRRRPIVLLKKSGGGQIAQLVAPGMDELGCMLAYTPLHHLLLSDFAGPLVMTSANLSEEPIAVDNEEAKERLAQIADAFLFHDRPIDARYDDSLCRVVEGKEVMLRRSRGYAPDPIKLPFRAQTEIIAFGAHLKNTFCLIKDDLAFVSQHIGDLENPEALAHEAEALNKYLDLFKLKPKMVACDLHPDYLASGLAREFAEKNGLPLYPVQHHHAHLLSCMTEHKITEPVIGVAFDGLGLGTDGTLWGGEFLIAAQDDFERFAHFKPVAMAGGQKAIKDPWRMALSYIFAAGDRSGFDPWLKRWRDLYGQSRLNTMETQIKRSLNAPLTSSCGRLFDAASSLILKRDLALFEGQAAMELEALAGSCKFGKKDAFPEEYSPELFLSKTDSGLVVDPALLLKAIVLDLERGRDDASAAYRFHQAISGIVLAICLMAKQERNLSTVCLSGGVFQNALLLGLVKSKLVQAGFAVFFPEKLPANDGGLCLGQAVAALAKSKQLSPL